MKIQDLLTPRLSEHGSCVGVDVSDGVLVCVRDDEPDCDELPVGEADSVAETVAV